MKLVREFLEFNRMNFERTGDPLHDMKIGEKAHIAQWLDHAGVENYKIMDDLTINVYGDANLVGIDIEELPEFIKFNEVMGGFYAGGNPWISLNGFPKEVYGDLQINSPSSPIKPHEKVRKFKENIIRKLIKVHGKVWN